MLIIYYNKLLRKSMEYHWIIGRNAMVMPWSDILRRKRKYSPLIFVFRLSLEQQQF